MRTKTPKATRSKWNRRSFRAGDDDHGMVATLEQTGLAILYWTQGAPVEGHYGRCLIPLDALKDAIEAAEKARRKRPE